MSICYNADDDGIELIIAKADVCKLRASCTNFDSTATSTKHCNSNLLQEVRSGALHGRSGQSGLLALPVGSGRNPI